MLSDEIVKKRTYCNLLIHNIETYILKKFEEREEVQKLLNKILTEEDFAYWSVISSYM